MSDMSKADENLLKALKEKIEELKTTIGPEDVKVLDVINDLEKSYTGGRKRFLDCALSVIFGIAEELTEKEKNAFGQNAIKAIVMFGINNGFVDVKRMEQFERTAGVIGNKKIPEC